MDSLIRIWDDNKVKKDTNYEDLSLVLDISSYSCTASEARHFQHCEEIDEEMKNSEG